jgi:hypothetical protein
VVTEAQLLRKHGMFVPICTHLRKILTFLQKENTKSIAAPRSNTSMLS